MSDFETRVLRLICPSLRPPSGSLRVMTYNVWDGPRHFEAVAELIERYSPDILALQEVTEPGIRRLVSELGYQGVFFSQPKNLRQGLRYINGKAILTRYPMETAYHQAFELDPLLREAACLRRGDFGELNEDRGVLGLEIQVGQRTLDVLCTHLALGDALVNAENLRQLHAFAHPLRVKGFDLLIMGDFNCHFGIHSEQDYHHYLTAYGKAPGNIIHPGVREAAVALQSEFPNAWDVALNREVVLVKQGRLSPEEAQNLYREAPAGSLRALQLLDAIDGNTHPTAHKRFDNILTPPGIEVVSLLVDHASQASDHSPVVAELSWSRHVPTQSNERDAKEEP